VIPANDFRRQWAEVGEDALAAVARVGASGWYVLGAEVRRFETQLAAWWGVEHAVGVGSGLDALEIGLRVLGCGPGDPVLTTPLSAFATALAIVRLGAVPVFADTGERGLIDLACCREYLKKHPEVRYFVPVHLYGHALDMEELERLRADFGLKMVEDCAQSIGARFRGRPTGTAGQVAATSFYPTKNLGAMGDGGALLTNDAELARRARVLRFYGETARYRHEEIGYNSRLDELQAAILADAFLPRLNGWIERRRAVARAYGAAIRHGRVAAPGAPPGSESSWHLFPVYAAPERRAALLDHLKAQGVAAGVHYPAAIPDQPALSRVPFRLAGDCSTARRICASEVSLPIHPFLTGAEIARVAEAVNTWEAVAQGAA
jgi:dTDP-4-amino-4,6-dideoxygalactose transaminase